MIGAYRDSQSQSALELGVADAYHSFGGMTLTMPDFIPCLSILSMKRLKLRNWSIVCTYFSQPLDPTFACISSKIVLMRLCHAVRGCVRAQSATYRLEDRYLSALEVMVRLNVFAIITVEI